MTEYMTQEYIQLLLGQIFDLISELEKYSVYNDDIINHEVNVMKKQAAKIRLMVSEGEYEN